MVQWCNGAMKAQWVLTIVLASVYLESHANCTQMLTVGQNSDRVGAHNWGRKLVFDGSVYVIVSS